MAMDHAMLSVTDAHYFLTVAKGLMDYDLIAPSVNTRTPLLLRGKTKVVLKKKTEFINLRGLCRMQTRYS